MAAVIAVWQLAAHPVRGLDERLARPRPRLDRARAHAAHRHRAPGAALRARARLAARGREALLSNIDVTAMFGFMAIARLLDPVRYPKLRTALRAAARPGARRAGAVPAGAAALGRTAFRSRTARRRIRTRSATRQRRPSACTSATRCSSPPARCGCGHAPCWPGWRCCTRRVVFVVILGTGNHYVLDTLVGSACAAAGLAAAHLTPRARSREVSPDAPPWRIALAGTGFALLAFLINGGFIGELV